MGTCIQAGASESSAIASTGGKLSTHSAKTMKLNVACVTKPGII